MKREMVEVDHVQVGLAPDLDRPAIVEPDGPCRRRTLLVHEHLDRQALSPLAVARPMREQIGRQRSVTDHLHVSAPIGQPDDRPRVGEHGAQRFLGRLGVVRERAQRPPAGGQQVVVHLPGVLARRCSDARDRAFRSRLVIRRVAEGIHGGKKKGHVLGQRRELL